jgi:hypothetical protein
MSKTSITLKFSISYVGNGYVTPLEVEILNLLQKERQARRLVDRNEIIETLLEMGYRKEKILEELDRDCYASLVRYFRMENSYSLLPLGAKIWRDLKVRANFQHSLIGLKILRRNENYYQLILMDSSFLPQKIRSIVRTIKLKKKPVMSYTGFFSLHTLISVLECIFLQMKVYQRKKTKRNSKETILELIKSEGRKAKNKEEWAWFVGTILGWKITVSPLVFETLKTMEEISKRPVDWKGKIVKENLMFNVLSKKGYKQDQIRSVLNYLMYKGLIREPANHTYTLTGLGYGYWKTIRRIVEEDFAEINFLIVRMGKDIYNMSICDSTSLPNGARKILEERTIRGKDLFVAEQAARSNVLSVLKIILPTLTIWKGRGKEAKK